MPRIHVSLAGHDIKFEDPDPKTEKFLKRARELAEDPRSKVNDLVALIYGKENPILDHTLFPERGAVTREVLDNPLYHVLTDLLARKEAALAGATPEKLGKRYTVTVRDAAQRTGVSEDAIRKAIKARRLPSWKRAGDYYLDPHTLDGLELGKRGPVPARVAPLEFRAGYNADSQVFLRLKLPDEERPRDKNDPDDDDNVSRWRRVCVLTGGHGKKRLFVLEPGADDNEIAFHDYFVRGKFSIVEKVNDAKAARLAWESFRAS